MADNTKIEWTEATWNPIRARTPDGKLGWHCEHASPGCEHCYAETQNIARRFDLGTGLAYKPGHRKDVEVFLDEATLLKPLGWKKGRKVFVCSMTDLFADFVTDAMIDQVFAVMALCPQHTFQVLTKRSARMREYFAQVAVVRQRIGSGMLFRGADRIPVALGSDWFPLPNVWLGVSVEDQQRADERIPDLLATPAAIRWISAEPLLGPVDLNRIREEFDGGLGVKWESALDGKRFSPWVGDDEDPMIPGFPKLDWVVVGGESGSKARPMHPDWGRALRDQCAAAGVPFFFKQWGQFMLAGDHLGEDHPEYLRLRRHDRTHVFEGDHQQMVEVGKKRAGRLLDGVLHDAMPGGGNG